MISFVRLYAHKYDIRGKVSSKFGPKQAYLIGKGFGSIVSSKGKNGPSVVVGCDVRPTGPELLGNLVAGLTDSGVDVYNILICTTPMVRFASTIYSTSASIMVTASHNEMDQNGFKFTLNGDPFYDSELQGLCDIIDANDFSNGAGKCKEQCIEQIYVENLCKDMSISNNISINWVARSEYMKILLESICNRIPGNNSITECTDKSKSDITFDFDTDVDRMMLYDKNLRQWNGDEITAFYALNMKRSIPNLKVVFDLKCSRVLLEWLRMQGIHCDISRIGNCFIHTKLKRNRGHLGGELSGHFMFYDYNNFSDDGLHSALRVSRYLTETSADLETFLSILPQLHVSKTIKIPCPTNKFEIIEQIRSILVSENITLQNNEEGAIVVHCNEGWYIIRTSQTENIITVRCEGFKKEMLDTILFNIEKLFSEVGVDIW